MTIYIPSLGRPFPDKGTVTLIPDSLRHDTQLVCQAHEARTYEPVAEKNGVNLLVLPENIRRIADTRAFLGQHAQDVAKTAKFIMLDDDIEFYTRRLQDTDGDDWWKLSGASEEEVEQIFDDVLHALETHAHVGVSGREGNNRVRESHVYNSRYMRLLAYQTDAYMSCEHERVEIMEDFDVSLQLLRKGLSSRVLYRHAQGQGKTQAAGGCSTWRTLEVHNEGVERLAELHPGLVKVRVKQNKTDRAGFGTRKEVTIQWKRAFEQGEKR